ncbi:MAG: 2'-5' RNA ligase family protein [Anaerolineaceae bacterium]|nr:2'-5' RNA ligase family protein [Anaerolineaceae bacterium]
MNKNHHSITEGLAVELYLDTAAEEQVLEFRDKIYAAGIKPVQGSMKDKPHVSLAVFPSKESAQLISITRELALTIQRFNFRLSALGTFPTTDNVLFLYPSPSVELLHVHAAFHKLIQQAGLKSSPYYYPGVWVPHLTLELEISSDEMCQSMHVFKDAFTPIEGHFTQLGLVGFRPIEYLDQFDLQ